MGFVVLVCSMGSFYGGHTWSSNSHRIVPPSVGATQPLVEPSDADLIAKVRSIDWLAPEPGVRPLVAAALPRSKALGDELLVQLLGTASDHVRWAIADFLTSAQWKAVPAIAVEWARSPADTERRRTGFLLLSMLPPSEQSLQLALAALLSGEADVRVLPELIRNVRRSGNPAPEQALAVTARLNQLVDHPDGRVRMAAIQGLAEWDRSQRFVAAQVRRLLADPVPEVRIAAIGASSIQQMMGSDIKLRLLEMASHPGEELSVREVALMNLERFDFNASEYGRLNSAVAQLSAAATAASQASTTKP
jgi:HEAT repeats